MSDAAIIDLRKEGLSCCVVAARLGITEQDVYNCMRRNKLQGRYRATNLSGGTTRPLVQPLTKYQRRTSGPQHGGFHCNGQELTPLQKLAEKIDALYIRHVLREDTWPARVDVERIIVRAVEEAGQE